jgi:glycosyltransferase involved in cell wall biosynthesis
MEALSFNMTEIILLSATGLFLLIQLLYYYGIYHRILAHNKAVKKGKINFSDDLPPVSVIIRACNESENLRRNLESVLLQDYPQFEVIVINDGFTDESQELLSQLETKYTNLYHSFTPEQVRNISSYKLSITLGIKASKYDWLVFTEAKSCPVSNQWLRLMARNFTPTTDIVLGYSSYGYQKGWRNKLECFDNLFQSMRYLGMALNNKPYMGIGRNMAYRKHLFFDNKGFQFLDIQRGEDDLFINEVANDSNTRVESSAEAATIVNSPAYDAIDWKRDKISYQITSQFYKGGQLYSLGFESTTRFLLYCTSIAGIAMGVIDCHWLVAGIAFLGWLIRYINQAIVINKTLKELEEKRRYYLTLPFFDFILPLQHFFRKFSRLMRKDSYRVKDTFFTRNA